MAKVTVQDIDRWFNIIHNDLYLIHCDLQKPNIQKMRKELNGLKDALLFDSCSGMMYLYNGKLYSNPEEINLKKNDDGSSIVTVIEKERLIYLLEQILKG